MQKTLILAIVLITASSGCIANMGDLKDRVSGEEDVTPAAVDDTPDVGGSTPVVNETPKRPPVARISVFAASGALLYKASFTAENSTEIVRVDAAGTVNLIAGDSEAIEPGASITSYAWTVNGKPVEGGRQASYEVAEPGLYAVTLAVTDSNGKSDTQDMKLALAPEPYEVTYDLVAGQVVGQEGDAPAEVAWDLAEPEEPATVQSVVIVASPEVTCDAILELLGPDGNSLGSADSHGHADLDQTETLELGAIDFGAYTIRIAPFLCASTETPISITVTLLPVIEGLDLDDGHGHAH